LSPATTSSGNLRVALDAQRVDALGEERAQALEEPLALVDGLGRQSRLRVDEVEAEVAQEQLLAEARKLPFLLARGFRDLPCLLLAHLGRHCVQPPEFMVSNCYVPAGRGGEACSLAPGLPRALPIILAGAAASLLLLPAAPGYDAWMWLLWGREVAGGGTLSTVDGPAFKPLPVAVCALLAPLGAAAPWLWSCSCGSLQWPRAGWPSASRAGWPTAR
jgi:hypothetical protein